MTKYLLMCECGKTVTVEVGQAGEQVTCQCGANLDVPTLRKMRHLPPAEAKAAPAARAWDLRKGTVTACGLMAGLLATVAFASWVTQPVVPEFDAQAYQRNIDTILRSETPAQMWQRWIGFYRPLAESGFFVFHDSRASAIEEQIAKRRFLQKTLMVVASIFAAVAAIAAFWPRRVARRR
jgi:hypothetical protein